MLPIVKLLASVKSEVHCGIVANHLVILFSNHHTILYNKLQPCWKGVWIIKAENQVKINRPANKSRKH